MRPRALPVTVLRLMATDVDSTLLWWAACGIAVANAHADVLANADVVTESNDEDGLAVALEALLSAKGDSMAHQSVT